MTPARLRIFLSILLLALSFGAAAREMPNFDQLEARLKIRPEQKAQYDMAVGATKRALLAVGLQMMQLKERLEAELGKDKPDLRALIKPGMDVMEETRPLFREAGNEWKKLQAILDDEQVEIVKSFLRENVSRLLQ
jgi:hypothetical protein